MSSFKSIERKGATAMVKTPHEIFRSQKLKKLHIAAVLAMATLAVSTIADARVARVKHETVTQQTFASPEQAGEALSAAWHHDSKKELLQIFGSAGWKLVDSGDPVAEQQARSRLAGAYDALHRIEYADYQTATLILGTDEFPYPVPLLKQGDAWSFDAKSGEQEILDRRVGRNELYAIEVCRTVVDAQREYAAQDAGGNGAHEYAARILSNQGSHDGLYWNVTTGQPESPLGPLVADAESEGYSAHGNKHTPYHGYYYRLLTKQGDDAPGGASDYYVNGHLTRGFALIAFPAKYGDSGIMTFMVNQDGIVFEKNLGPHTVTLARRITEYNPDQTWDIPK